MFWVRGRRSSCILLCAEDACCPPPSSTESDSRASRPATTPFISYSGVCTNRDRTTVYASSADHFNACTTKVREAGTMIALTAMHPPHAEIEPFACGSTRRACQPRPAWSESSTQHALLGAILPGQRMGNRILGNRNAPALSASKFSAVLASAPATRPTTC